METRKGNKAETRNSWSLAAGVVSLLFILLVLPGPGFSAITVLDPINSYFFAATSYNSTGLESVYFTIVNSADSAPPIVALTSPPDGAIFNDIVSISVTLPETVGIAKVQFFVNDIQTAETTTSPFVFSWNTSALLRGDYNISVKAIDSAGNEELSGNLAVTVAGDTVAPTVSWSAPGNIAAASGTIVISASASDNVKVVGMEIYQDDTLVWSGSQNSASYTWDTAKESNGSHVFVAKAYDAAGNIGLSSPLALSVFNDTTAPIVSIGAPATSTAGGTVLVTANASDNVGVTKVEFYLNGALQMTSTSTPYSFNWNTQVLANGAYMLSAKAYDAVGNIGQSANVAVNVFNDTAAPTVDSFSMPATTNTSTVAVSSFRASDNVGVTGYLVTESSTAPAASAAGWTLNAPANFTFAGTGVRTAYAWAKDASGNISVSRAVSVLIDATLPAIKNMSLLRGSQTVTIKVSATDDVAVTKLQLYVDEALQLESSNGALAYVWSVTYKGTHTITAMAYDAAGNVRSQSLSINK